MLLILPFCLLFCKAFQQDFTFKIHISLELSVECSKTGTCDGSLENPFKFFYEGLDFANKNNINSLYIVLLDDEYDFESFTTIRDSTKGGASNTLE